MLLLFAIAIASAGVPVVLPPGESAEDWRAALDLAGLLWSEGAARVTVVRDGTSWVIRVASSSGPARTLSAPIPITEADREAFAFLARALVRDRPELVAAPPVPVPPPPAQQQGDAAALGSGPEPAQDRVPPARTAPAPVPSAPTQPPTPAAQTAGLSTAPLPVTQLPPNHPSVWGAVRSEVATAPPDSAQAQSAPPPTPPDAPSAPSPTPDAPPPGDPGSGYSSTAEPGTTAAPAAPAPPRPPTAVSTAAGVALHPGVAAGVSVAAAWRAHLSRRVLLDVEASWAPRRALRASDGTSAAPSSLDAGDLSVSAGATTTPWLAVRGGAGLTARHYAAGGLPAATHGLPHLLAGAEWTLPATGRAHPFVSVRAVRSVPDAAGGRRGAARAHPAPCHRAPRDARLDAAEAAQPCSGHGIR